MSQPTVPEPDAILLFHMLRIRRRSAAEWCLWLLWLIVLVLLAEFALTSLGEHERQAGILSSMLALGWLLGGIIVEVMKSIALRDNADMVGLDGETDTSGVRHSGNQP